MSPPQPPTDLVLRRLSYADLPQVIGIERRSFPTPWSLAMFVLELSKPSGICLAATQGGRIVGYLVCSRYAAVWHLMNICVDPDKRRHGIAAALLRRLLERIDDPDAQLTLEVRRSNEPAIALYEQFGFRGAGLRRRYYQDNGEDALIMWRTSATVREGSQPDESPSAQPDDGAAARIGEPGRRAGGQAPGKAGRRAGGKGEGVPGVQTA